MGKQIAGICLLAGLLTGCSFFRSTAPEPEVRSDWPAPDSAMADMLERYRPALEAKMGTMLAEVRDTLRFGKPEGSLGNLVADALRFRAARELETFVHVGIVGDEMFTLYLEPGSVTLGDIYEFIPYESDLVVLKMNGSQLGELIHQVAARGGAPVSGVRFRIRDDHRAGGVLVNSEILDPEREYLVATSSRAANGGDMFPALWNVSQKENLRLPLRHVIADYISTQSVLYNDTDGRIRR